jgi:hypothetical protein
MVLLATAVLSQKTSGDRAIWPSGESESQDLSAADEADGRRFDIFR